MAKLSTIQKFIMRILSLNVDSTVRCFLLGIMGIGVGGGVCAQTMPTYITPSTTSWAFVTETATGSGAFVNGPGAPPSGSPGSAQITVNNPGGEYLYTQQYVGTRLDQIAGLSYNTYVVSSGILETANLQFDFDPGQLPAPAGYQGRAAFVPATIAGAVQVGVWQTWNPMTQRAWVGTGNPATRVLAAACTLASPCTWSQILATFPNAKMLAAGSFGFKVGNSLSAAVISVDSFSIGTAGVAGAVNAFNFAISAPLPPPPSVPVNLACSAPATMMGKGVINCTYSPASSTLANPISSYQLVCAHDALGITLQTVVAATETLASIANAPIGRYTCNVRAIGTASVSAASSVARLVLPQMPLSLSGQYSPNGTGFGAILVRNSSATSVPSTTVIGRFIGPVNGPVNGNIFNFTPATDVGNTWRILGLGDIAGSNKSSVLARNLTDDVRADTIVGNGSSSIGTILRKAKPEWVLEAVIDLDGDGKADMVWRYTKPGTNDSGVIYAWFMAGDPSTASVSEVIYRGGAPLDWSLIGGIDLNGDGKGDLVWLSPNNDIRSLTSTSRSTWVNERIGQLPAGYSIQKLGDFNADGKGDILFKDATGRVKIWIMDGTRISIDADMPIVAATTTFYATGDFDGDGTMDIVWKKADGTLTIWLMNKSVINQPTIIDNVGVAPLGLVVE